MTNTGYSSTPGKHRHSLAALDAETVRAKGAEAALDADLGTLELAVASLAARVTALEAPTVPPTTGIPPIPAGTGTLLRKDFSDGTLAPFLPLLYPNSHDYTTDPSQLMRQYCKYVTDAAHISVHDGYLELACTRNPAVSNPAGKDAWLASFVGTFSPSTFTKSFNPPFRVRWCAKIEAPGKGGWPGCWVYGTWLNGDLEVPDWPEVIGGRITANLHPGSKQIAAGPIPAGWAIYESIVEPTLVTVKVDGTAMGSGNITTRGPLGLFIDSKVGLAAPDASTGEQRIKVAWVAVDPA